jgi:hypothetical protein
MLEEEGGRRVGPAAHAAEQPARNVRGAQRAAQYLCRVSTACCLHPCLHCSCALSVDDSFTDWLQLDICPGEACQEQPLMVLRYAVQSRNKVNVPFEMHLRVPISLTNQIIARDCPFCAVHVPRHFSDLTRVYNTACCHGLPCCTMATWYTRPYYLPSVHGCIELQYKTRAAAFPTSSSAPTTTKAWSGRQLHGSESSQVCAKRALKRRTCCRWCHL